MLEYIQQQSARNFTESSVRHPNIFMSKKEKTQKSKKSRKKQRKTGNFGGKILMEGEKKEEKWAFTVKTGTDLPCNAFIFK